MGSGRSFNLKYFIPVFLLTLSTVSLSFVLISTRNQLAITAAELSTTSSNLNLTQGKLTGTEEELSKTKAELSSEKISHVKTMGTLTETQANLSMSQMQLESKSSAFQDLQTNYDRVTTGYGYVLNDPSYQAMKTFVLRDTTDQKVYNTDTYNCYNFTADVIANANKQHIRCGFAYIKEQDSAHAVVAFDTADKGLVYVEPQSDEEVNLQTGKQYYTCVVSKPGYYTVKPDFDDTIKGFTVIW